MLTTQNISSEIAFCCYIRVRFSYETTARINKVTDPSSSSNRTMNYAKKKETIQLQKTTYLASHKKFRCFVGPINYLCDIIKGRFRKLLVLEHTF